MNGKKRKPNKLHPNRAVTKAHKTNGLDLTKFNASRRHSISRDPILMAKASQLESEQREIELSLKMMCLNA